MPDVFAVAELFVDLVRREAADDVALIAYYGSHATGAATPQSDLDLYYIPDPGPADHLYRSLVYQGCPFEFWGVPWPFAEHIAAGRHRWCVAPSIIANARVLYARSEADRARFAGLQADIAALQQPENRARMVKLAQETFANTAAPLDRLEQAATCSDLVGTRWATVQLIDAVLDCLALLNQVFLVRNWTSDITQLERLHYRPNDLEKRIESLLTVSDPTIVHRMAAELLADTRVLILDHTRSIRENADPAQVFNGYYAAIQEYVTKILKACDHGNWIGASAVAVQMQKELASMLAYVEEGIPYSEFNWFAEYRAVADRLGFPDLTPALETRDVDLLASLVRKFLAQSEAYFTHNGIPINSANTFDELKQLIG